MKGRIVYAVTSRAGKKYYTPVGVAFTGSSRNGKSLKIRLDALPVSGELWIPFYDDTQQSTNPPASPAEPGDEEAPK